MNTIALRYVSFTQCLRTGNSLIFRKVNYNFYIPGDKNRSNFLTPSIRESCWEDKICLHIHYERIKTFIIVS